LLEEKKKNDAWMVIVHGGFGCLWRRQEAAVVVGGEVVSCFWKKVWIGQVGCEMNGEKGRGS